ncbi:malate:quinone oxidoreductase [Staphylococcus gallinarum]|uniref:malate dehydrogenase (quinone) n=1 Tax=Staphylococcus gallinarum TaxID=1293 RepID=A0A380FMH0_STAGA|nr:malate:quinone oxidoreductase [Staphylococcus gallinarum]
MEGRTSHVPMAITYDKTGTDVNFSALTKKLFDNLADKQVELNYKHQVEDLKQRKDGVWEVKVKDLTSNEVKIYMKVTLSL